MRGASKKMFISILTSVIVFVTMVATTFAWVGIFTYANVDAFQMNLKVNKSSNYFLTISSKDSSNNADYGDNIPLDQIQRQALKNWGIQVDDSLSTSAINSIFNTKNKIAPSTPYYTNSANIDHFEQLTNLTNWNPNLVVTNSYIKFDMYLSVNTLEGIDEETTGVNANVVLDEIDNTLVGNLNNYILHHGNTIRRNPYYPSNFNWKYYDAHSSLTSVSFDDFGNEVYTDKTEIIIDSSSSARFALELYNPIKFSDTYTGNETPINTIIYQGGSALPTYNENSNIYSMGGILPEEYNFGVQEANHNHGGKLSIPSQTINNEYKVKELKGTKLDNYIWNAPEYGDIDTNNINYLGVENGIQTKQKITIYFWIEGWDADCTWAIDLINVTLSLTFTADTDL